MSALSEFDIFHDVVVVGARCAGAATAMLMARSGKNVLVIDKRAYGTDTNSTHALMRGAVMQLGRWGLIDKIKTTGAPAIRKTSFHYGTNVVEVDVKPQGAADGLYAPRRYVLDRLLVDAARKTGATFMFGCSLVDLIRDEKGRVIGAIIRNDRGETLRVRAGTIVGADGVKSKVARLAGAETTRAGKSASGVVYGYWRGATLDGSHWCYRRGTATGAIPTNDGAACVFAAVPQEQFGAIYRPDMAAGYHKVLRWTAPWMADWVEAAESCGKLRGFGGIAGFVRKPFGPGWALVGDAAYFKDPLTAHGITDAFRDAELLALAVEKGTPEAFQTYQELRDLLSQPLFDITDRIASFDWNLEDLGDLHYRLSEIMKAEVSVIADLGNAFARRYAENASRPAFLPELAA